MEINTRYTPWGLELKVKLDNASMQIDLYEGIPNNLVKEFLNSAKVIHKYVDCGGNEDFIKLFLEEVGLSKEDLIGILEEYKFD